MDMYLPSFGDGESFEFNVNNRFPERTKDWREESHAFTSNLPGILHFLYVIQCQNLARSFVPH